MRQSKLSMAFFATLFLATSCSSNKALVSQDLATNTPTQILVQETLEVPILNQGSSMIEAATKEKQPVLFASNAEITQLTEAVKGTKYENRIVELKAVLAKTQQANTAQVNTTQKLNFVEKLVIKKLEKKIKKAQPVDYRSWNSFLKIGVVLLGIGVILAIVGLNVIGGIAALIGLAFTILGLVAEV
jgi:hypothetical protein